MSEALAKITQAVCSEICLMAEASQMTAELCKKSVAERHQHALNQAAEALECLVDRQANERLRFTENHVNGNADLIIDIRVFADDSHIHAVIHRVPWEAAKPDIGTNVGALIAEPPVRAW